MPKQNKFTRRQFIKSAAVVSASVATANVMGGALTPTPAAAALVPDK